MEPEKRHAILSAATDVFVENSGASMDELAKRAGVSKGTLYQLCENKADLFYQCVHADLRRCMAHVGTCIDPRKSATTILPEMFASGIAYAREHPLVRGLFSGKHAGSAPEWSARFTELRRIGDAPVAEVLRLGIRRGELASTIDVDAVASVIQDTTYAGFVVYGERWGRDASEVERWIDALLRLSLRGLRKREPVSARAARPARD